MIFPLGTNASYGYIKVVDDLNNLDMDGIKKEISSFKTLISGPMIPSREQAVPAADKQGFICLSEEPPLKDISVS